MTDEEIMKKIEWVIKCNKGELKNCIGCPVTEHYPYCDDIIIKASLALIKRQKYDIERLVKQIEAISNNPAIAVTFNKDQKEEIAGYIELQVKKIKAQAIKEIAERLCEGRVSNDPVVVAVKVQLKEMAGDPHV